MTSGHPVQVHAVMSNLQLLWFLSYNNQLKTALFNVKEVISVQLRVLCVWPMKCHTLSQWSSFPVPQGKGNVGSGNETVRDAHNVCTLTIA